MFKTKKTTNLVDIMGEPTCVGTWKREKELGSGGFGIVNLWVNKNNGDTLAIKKCRWHLESQLNVKQRNRWTLEVEMMKNVQHPNIVGYKKIPAQLLEALMKSNTLGLPILSMEYCLKGNLRNVLSNPLNCCGMPEIDVLYILSDISNGLLFLHSLNITHRDIKPENIVLQNCNFRKGEVIYKIIDLGYAKELNSQTASFVGTLQYLAPEIFIKQKYSQTVDYWSLGIMTYEIISGVRPFLPTFTTVQSIPYLEKKPSDTISIQMNHSGEIQFSKELPRENHIGMCLKHSMEKWLRLALEYDPDKRGSLSSIQSIVIKRIITVFSIFTCEFYNYEVSESTLFSTLQDWIERDTAIQKSDQYIIKTRKINSGEYAMNYYDELNSEAMLYVFKKNASISKNICIFLPKHIKVLFMAKNTEFKFGTLKLLHAQTIFLIVQEEKYVNVLKSAICFLSDYLKKIFNEEKRIFVKIKDLLSQYVSEIEFYNYIENLLYKKVYQNVDNDKLKCYLQEYQNCMEQLQEMIDIFNTLKERHKKIVVRYDRLQHVSNEVLDCLISCNFSDLTKQAVKIFEQKTPITNLYGGSEVLSVVSKTIKIRDSLLKDQMLLGYLQGATCFWKEIHKLTLCMNGIHDHFHRVKDALRTVQMKKLEMLPECYKNNYVENITDISSRQLVEQNTDIRYDFQQLLNIIFLKHKNEVSKLDQESMLSYLVNGIN